ELPLQARGARDAHFRAAAPGGALRAEGRAPARRGDRARLRPGRLAPHVPRAVARGLGGAPFLFRAHRRGAALPPRAGAAHRSGRSGVSRARLVVVAAVIVALAVFFATGGYRYFTFENVKTQQAALTTYYEQHPGTTALVFFLLYVTFTGLSLV